MKKGKNKKMSWIRKGAHNVLQIMVFITSKIWDHDWNNAFEVMITT
jgi:hypothetical protein